MSEGYSLPGLGKARNRALGIFLSLETPNETKSAMKKLYTLILLLALFTCAAQAQVVLVSENFSSSSQTNVAAVTNGSWFVYSGVYMTTQTSGSATSVVQANITKPISALDADIRVKWTGVRQSNNGQSSGFDSNVFLCYKIGNGAVQKVQIGRAHV